jgi:hypothetical protein
LKEARVSAELGEGSGRVQEWSFCRFGQSAEGRGPVVLGSGNCIGAEMIAAVAVDIASTEVAGGAEAEIVVALAVETELGYFGNFRTDSSILAASRIAPATVAGLA